MTALDPWLPVEQPTNAGGGKHLWITTTLYNLGVSRIAGHAWTEYRMDMSKCNV